MAPRQLPRKPDNRTPRGWARFFGLSPSFERVLGPAELEDVGALVGTERAAWR
jgi:hypothetical protein